MRLIWIALRTCPITSPNETEGSESQGQVTEFNDPTTCPRPGLFFFVYSRLYIWEQIISQSQIESRAILKRPFSWRECYQDQVTPADDLGHCPLVDCFSKQMFHCHWATHKYKKIRFCRNAQILHCLVFPDCTVTFWFYCSGRFSSKI